MKKIPIMQYTPCRGSRFHDVDNCILLVDMFEVPEKVAQEIYPVHTGLSAEYSPSRLNEIVRDPRNPTIGHRQNIDLKWGFHFAPRSARASIMENGLVPEYCPGAQRWHDPSERRKARRNSVFFYTSPVVYAMTYFGDVLWKNLDYDLWIVDIQHCELVIDENIGWYYHSHDNGICVYTPVSVRTQEWYNARLVSFVEVPDHIRDEYAMNGS